MAENNHLPRSDRVPFRLRESRAPAEADAQDIEEISRDRSAPHSLRKPLSAGEAKGTRGISSGVDEDGRFRHEVPELEIGE